MYHSSFKSIINHLFVQSNFRDHKSLSCACNRKYLYPSILSMSRLGRFSSAILSRVAEKTRTSRSKL